MKGPLSGSRPSLPPSIFRLHLSAGHPFGYNQRIKADGAGFSDAPFVCL
jgi:hypothetical protein